jgi:GT2 family glycosyltransferase
MDTLKCIEYLYKINYHNYHVIIVDNGSRNASVSEILKAISGKTHTALFSKQEIEEEKYDQEIINKLQLTKSIIIIKMDKNYGFAEGK